MDELPASSTGEPGGQQAESCPEEGGTLNYKDSESVGDGNVEQEDLLLCGPSSHSAHAPHPSTSVGSPEGGDVQSEHKNEVNQGTDASLIMTDSKTATFEASKKMLRVSFPEDSMVVSGYMDPPTPWHDGEKQLLPFLTAMIVVGLKYHFIKVAAYKVHFIKATACGEYGIMGDVNERH